MLFGQFIASFIFSGGFR